MVQTGVLLLPSVLMGRNQNHPAIMRTHGVPGTSVIIRVGGRVEAMVGLGDTWSALGEQVFQPIILPKYCQKLPKKWAFFGFYR